MSRPNFDALRDLHNSANDMLHSPVIKRVLVHHQHEKWVTEVSEASLRMLDICGTTRDVLLLVKDHLQELQSAFRRVNVGETAAEDRFASHRVHRKVLRKEMLKRLRLLKGMKSQLITLLPDDHNLTVVVNVLREVRMTTMSIVESLMALMAMPGPMQKTNKGSFASKFTRVNSLSFWEKCDATALHSAHKRLEAVEMAIEDLEVELDCIFRRLIRTRVSLLNLLTN
ncbi:hypothetical protein RJ640_020754 [Escallonia rubra]|uniref:Uncharacterized protein n=1 Tax=Escallonia rubra TaxID=112253 RepID=A0AA88URV0_9ASTE|nr:hypothetical protein RJ640_020754 [Escallonia rubra]